MSNSPKTLEFQFERRILAAPTAVFDAWLNPKIPGNPWHIAERFLLDPKVDGLFYWTLRGTSHYGRFTDFEPAARMRHTWVSPNTLGRESIVTVTFQKDGDATHMTLIHAGLPDDEKGKSHESGWNFFLETFSSNPWPA